ncbi:HdeD family acid-resistance protein [Paracoccus pacificus]|uniref:HdeD family acid-resistance protein n=1 Tax=Paracoccus pacificus TaxID=1463598 RepID=A0ABW4RBA1_9RHOB
MTLNQQPGIGSATSDPALRVLAENWWVPLLRGIAGILLGLLALFMPGATLASLLLVFGVFAVVDGVLAIVMGFRRRSHDDQWWSWALDGVLSIIIGLMALFWPAATALAFVIWIAAWAVVGGVLRIIAAIRLRHEIEGEWALGLSGLLSIIFGILIMVAPDAGLISIVWLIGIFALIFGVSMVMLAFRLRSLKP